jgi:hypothetical protein
LRLEKIDSLDDPRVAIYRDLKDATIRGAHGLFVVESRLCVQRLITESRFIVHSVFVTETALEGLRDALAKLQENLETFLAEAEESGRAVPRFVERELRAFLDCGILSRGFLRVRCKDCGKERLVAFSCKGRGFCPSCTSRRMSDTAAHLVDRVLPEAPVRQWVLSLPIPLRYRVAYDHELCSAVLAVFLRAVFGALRHRAKNELGIAGGA